MANFIFESAIALFCSGIVVGIFIGGIIVGIAIRDSKEDESQIYERAIS